MKYRNSIQINAEVIHDSLPQSMDITEDTKLKERIDASNETWNADIRLGIFQKKTCFICKKCKVFKSAFSAAQMNIKDHVTLFKTSC
jgi:hypothetical protein